MIYIAAPAGDRFCVENYLGTRWGRPLADRIEFVPYESLFRRRALPNGVIIALFFTSITDALSKGEKVELRGFGSFRVRHRLPRKGRNPKTGAHVAIPAKCVPFFKAGKDLRALVDAQ